MLSAPAFQPTPESQTYFILNSVLTSMAGIGFKSILVQVKNFDWRVEGIFLRRTRRYPEPGRHTGFFHAASFDSIISTLLRCDDGAGLAFPARAGGV